MLKENASFAVVHPFKAKSFTLLLRIFYYDVFFVILQREGLIHTVVFLTHVQVFIMIQLTL
ncbi:hypothetical protein PMEGAPR185_40050 [Priestia megaterium]